MGLPRSVREKLLAQYRDELRHRLLALQELKARLSGRSGQSATLSLDGGLESAAAASERRLMLRTYK